MVTTDASQTVARLIEGYIPRHVPQACWRLSAAGVRQAAHASTSTPRMAKVALPSLAAFAEWLVLEGYRVEVGSLADRALIERYVQTGMPGRTEATRATRRATLRRIAARLDPPAAPALEQIVYRRARAPYMSVEIERFFDVADAQPTLGRRDSMTAILALGLGCGLHRQDLAWVRGVDVIVSDTIDATAMNDQASGGEAAHASLVTVRVTGGPRPRTVVALDAYAPLIAERAGRAGDDLLIGGTFRGRVNVTGPTLDRIITDRSVSRVVPARLRSTWLVTHLNLATPLAVLLPAAGIASSRTLDDLLPYTNPLPVDTVTALLRGRAR